MNERPLSLNAVMSLAAILGHKTETRRPLNPQPKNDKVGPVNAGYCGYPGLWLVEGAVSEYTRNEEKAPTWTAPFGSPGTELWLREPGRVSHHATRTDLEFRVRITFAADGSVSPLIAFPHRLHREGNLPRWARRCDGIPNGIFREAARYKSAVLEVRAERLQDITEEGARAEGVEEAVKSWLGKYLPKWEPQCWLSPDNGETYCRRCAQKAARELRREGEAVEVDGGWSLASIDSDIFEECAGCGKLLETSINDPSYYLPVDGVYDGYLTAEEIAMVYNFGTDSLSLKEGYAREAYRVLWDSIYGKRPGLSWNCNPWVFVTGFKPMKPME